MKGRVGEEALERYRATDCSVALPLLSEHLKLDPDFTPIKNSHAHRWHLLTDGQQYELLTAGPKWFDTRANRGGGAVDLTMHLCKVDFKQAVGKLREVLP